MGRAEVKDDPMVYTAVSNLESSLTKKTLFLPRDLWWSSKRESLWYFNL